MRHSGTKIHCSSWTKKDAQRHINPYLPLILRNLTQKQIDEYDCEYDCLAERINNNKKQRLKRALLNTLKVNINSHDRRKHKRHHECHN